MISKLQKVGIALGSSTYGTAAGSFTRGLLVRDFSVNPSDGAKPISEVRGDLSTRRVGLPPLDFDASFKFPLDVGDSASANIGDFLLSVMGADSVAGSNPYQHTFTRQDSATPPWHNIYSDKDVTDNKQYTGFRADSVKFSIDGGASEIGVEVGGVVKDEAVLGGVQSLSFSGSPLLLPSQAGTFTIGIASVVNFDKVDITIKRGQTRFHPVGNSRRITNAYTKDFSIELGMQGIDFTDEVERAKFLAGTSSIFNLILTDANSNYLRFNFPEFYYQSWKGPDIADTELLRINAAGFVTGNSYSVILQNARSTAYSA